MTPLSFVRLHRRYATAIIGACLVSGAYAEDVIRHGAHQHGLSHLDIAVDGNVVLVSLHGPMVNFTGFEHAPTTARQEQLLANTTAALGNPELLFTINPDAACTVRDAHIASPDFEYSESDATHAHDERGHGHDASHESGHGSTHEHGDGNGDRNRHSHEDPHSHSGTHHDLSVEFEYRCTGHVEWLDLHPAFFDRFAWTESVQANVIAADVQKREVLTPRAHRLTLTR